jgi:hypothetical protein
LGVFNEREPAALDRSEEDRLRNRHFKFDASGPVTHRVSDKILSVHASHHSTAIAFVTDSALLLLPDASILRSKSFSVRGEGGREGGFPAPAGLLLVG